VTITAFIVFAIRILSLRRHWSAPTPRIVAPGAAAPPKPAPGARVLLERVLGARVQPKPAPGAGVVPEPRASDRVLPEPATEAAEPPDRG
jgi:hypothetical protein